MRHIKFFIPVIAALLLCCPNASHSAEWQWSVKVNHVSDETDSYSEAFLWIPPTCEKVKAVMVGMHNMSEEDLMERPLFRNAMSELGIAIVWISPIIDFSWDVTKGVQEVFWQMMDDLANESGYLELSSAPIVPVGHSAMATYPWNFAAWNPERTLAVISLHGDAPRTNLTGYGGSNLEWGRTRNIDGIPGLMIEGEYEWWEARVNPALAFRMMYPESTVSFLFDAGRGHFDVADKLAAYIALFLKKALCYRLPEETEDGKPSTLKKLDPRDGWLAERWRIDGRKRPEAAPYSKYKGNSHDAFWYFDEEIALATERYYSDEMSRPREQYIGFEQDGSLITFDPELHARMKTDALLESDGLTFHVKPVFTDTLRRTLSAEHSSSPISVDRICGPVRKVNDTTFVVDFYRMGMHNRRRTNDIWLVASNDGDKRYKTAVQQLNVHIPYRNTVGKRQAILFPSLPDVAKGTEAIPLSATSDSGLPVSYYVKAGPAEVEGSTLRFTPVPIHAKYPIKVTVVAWQYGIAGKVQTAEPIERELYIIN